MRKLLKIFGWTAAGLLGTILVLAIVVYALSNRRLTRHYEVKVAPVPVPTDAEAIARGHHLAITRGCTDCHGADLGGAKIVDDPAVGRIYGPNITRGAGGLSPEFGDADWIRAIRHGVAPGGRPLFLMPSQEFAHFSNDDLGALLAYLNSAAPVARPSVAVKLGPVARALIVSGKMVIPAEIVAKENIQPDTSKPGVTIEYGRYLATGCVGCHGNDYAGGKIPGGPPDWPAAANLTPGSSRAIASWTSADFLRALREGRRPDGAQISPVMPRNFGQMTDDELNAIWLFLKSLPAVDR